MYATRRQYLGQCFQHCELTGRVSTYIIFVASYKQGLSFANILTKLANSKTHYGNYTLFA